MASLVTIELSAELVDLARRDAEMFQRSIRGQVEHWARLGRAIEASPGFALDRIKAALEGRFDADGLEPDEKEIYWDLLGEALREPLPEAERFFEGIRHDPGAAGYDDHGRLVRVGPNGREKVVG